MTARRRQPVAVSIELQLELFDQLEQARAYIDRVLAGHVAVEDLVDQVRLIYSRTQNALVATNDARFGRASTETRPPSRAIPGG